MLSSSRASQSLCSSDTDLVDELQSSSQCTRTTPEMEEETDSCYSPSSISEEEEETTGSGPECDGHQKQSTNTTKKQRKVLPHVYRCSYPNCEKEFPRKSRLERHHRKHSNEKPFICTIAGCEKSFTCKFYLNRHMKRPHNKTTCKKEKKVHQCGDCGKTFKHKFDLKTHSAVHSGEKPFKCDICAESFALRGRLKKHMKRHDGYPCQRDECDFVGDSWSTLQKHISAEHRKLHRCKLCDHEFHSAHKLRAHSAEHKQHKKKYLCPYEGCDRIYLRKFNLRAHNKAVHSNETFKCEYAGCDHEVRYQSSYIRHMKTHEKKSMNRDSKINLGNTKSMAAVLSQFEITKEQNYRIVRGEMLEDCELSEAQ